VVRVMDAEFAAGVDDLIATANRMFPRYGEPDPYVPF
jgi:hypothetical protein